MGDYISIADVRRVTGMDTTIVPDSEVTDTITEIEKKVDRFLNTTGVPRKVTEIRDGDGTKVLIVNKLPLLRIVSLKIDGTAISLSKTFTDLPVGKVRLDTDAEETVFKEKEHSVILEYFYGLQDETQTETTTSNAETAGSSVTVEVVNGSNILDGDWVRIVGTDGNEEITKIISGGGTNNLVMDLSYDHAAGSQVIRMEVPEPLQELAGVLAGIKLVARVVGATFDEITGYGLDELSVQKGEPYTQWRETAIRLIEVRDQLLKRLRPMPSFG